ncbi:MAG: hypothetical protein OXF72_11500 [Gammaproteobacteria bacterium]|nr:hypothetical protein [Gammaproteobacteria bacterium]MCY4200499.1 hypothetical protein [Gammaproteobacteria bacterium]MCY4276653.1 hypothetical protein [Gammaproteobacteria bacterium]
MRFTGVALIAALIACSLAHAQSAWDLVFREQLDWTSREHRLILSRDLLDRVTLLESNLPTMSERDVQWVEQLEARIERLGDDATSSQRGRLYLSRQYQHRALLEHTQRMRDELGCVQAAAAMHDEMLCWGQVAVELLDGERIDVAIETLRDHRMIPRPREMPVGTLNPSIWYGEFGRGIVEYLLLPYLASQNHRDEGANS